MIKDGVALVKFYMWAGKGVPQEIDRNDRGGKFA